jgi:hypothetical protein
MAIAILCTALPASAALNTVPQGGTVFVGEEGLDITATGVASGGQLVWFGEKGKTTDVPAAVVTVGDAADFYVSAADFSSRIGPWYVEPARTLAFYVKDPSLELRVSDESAGFLITPSVTWIPKGDAVSFRVTSSVWELSKRPGVTGAPVSIRLVGQDGVKYASVDGYSLENVVLTASPFSTGAVWQTGKSEYPRGNYTAWVECNANRMMDNYPVEGKTRSAPVTFLVQSVNPLITTTLTTAPTTAPATSMPAATTVTTVVTTSVTTQGTTAPPVTTTATAPVTTSRTATPGPTPAPGFEGILCLVGIAAAGLAWARRKRP